MEESSLTLKGRRGGAVYNRCPQEGCKQRCQRFHKGFSSVSMLGIWRYFDWKLYHGSGFRKPQEWTNGALIGDPSPGQGK